MAQKGAETEVLSNQRPHHSTRPKVTPRLWRALRDWGLGGQLAGFLLALGSALILGYLFFNPNFRVVKVEVQGNLVLPSEEAVKDSQALGVNLFLLDPAEVGRQLMKTPYIRQVRVERLLPNRLRLTIWERFPSVSWWAVPSPQRLLVDNSGVVLGVEKPGMSDLIYIIDLDGTPVEKQVDPEAVRTAQQVFSRLYTDLGIPLYPFEFQKGPGITAVSAAGWRACFGTSAQLEEKVRSLVALLQSDIKFRVVDLRIPDQLTYH